MIPFQYHEAQFVGYEEEHHVESTGDVSKTSDQDTGPDVHNNESVNFVEDTYLPIDFEPGERSSVALSLEQVMANQRAKVVGRKRLVLLGTAHVLGALSLIVTDIISKTKTNTSTMFSAAACAALVGYSALKAVADSGNVGIRLYFFTFVNIVCQAVVGLGFGFYYYRTKRLADKTLCGNSNGSETSEENCEIQTDRLYQTTPTTILTTGLLMICSLVLLFSLCCITFTRRRQSLPITYTCFDDETKRWTAGSSTKDDSAARREEYHEVVVRSPSMRKKLGDPTDMSRFDMI